MIDIDSLKMAKLRHERVKAKSEDVINNEEQEETMTKLDDASS